jgi:hypothetical protein
MTTAESVTLGIVLAVAVCAVGALVVAYIASGAADDALRDAADVRAMALAAQAAAADVRGWLETKDRELKSDIDAYIIREEGKRAPMREKDWLVALIHEQVPLSDTATAAHSARREATEAGMAGRQALHAVEVLSAQVRALATPAPKKKPKTKAA